MFPWLVLAALALGCLLAAKRLIHYFQLESYQHPGYFRTLRRNLLKAVLPGLMMFAVWTVSAALLALLIPEEMEVLSQVLVSFIVIAAGALTGRFLSERNAKKPLRYTPRVKRLYAVSLICFFLILVLFRSIGFNAASAEREAGVNPAGYMLFLFPLFLPLWIALTGLIAWPVEKLISEMYFRDARRILDSRKDLIRIGITGSWGKTSVKFILGTILEEKYHTLVTPSSYNTPMGVTKVIRSSLEPGHRVFVAEMGARHVGDIKEMCRLVHPVYGVLTSVGPQHLDTFRTVERVAKTKYELMDAIPTEGHCFFADDGGICRDLYEKTGKPKSIAGLDSGRDDVWAEDIAVTPEGSRFLLCTRSGKTPCSTRMLGELNIRNILLCASVALELGLTPEQIARGIAKIKPVEHRLELIDNPGGITIIDDAFNSNIRGAEQAFQVLKSFSPTRIVITPGMVELGAAEQEMNRRFGEMMCGCCDIAVLVGKKRSAAIREGLAAGGFPEENIHVADTLDDAAAYMRSVVKPGDIVLFENDLPDNYSE